MNVTKEELARRKAAFLWNPWNDETKPKPDWIAPTGLKYWVDPSLTEYARKEQVSWNTLPALTAAYVYCCEFPTGEKTRVFYYKDQPVEEAASYEGMAVKIDKWKIMRNSNEL